MGLEINLLSFIPLITKTKKNNLNNSEAALNYFLIQAFASIIILFSFTSIIILININFFFLNSIIIYFLLLLTILPLILKLGAAPFHFWFPNVRETLNWINNLILITWQKLGPIIILSYLNLNNYLFIFVFLSTFIGSIGGFNQLSLRKLMTFSSINHIGWIIISLIFNEFIWWIYFILYSILNFSIIYLFKTFQIFYLNQIYNLFINSYLIKFYLIISILSLGGLPPFLGFFPKWLIIQSLILLKINIIILFLIIIRLITLFYYLKIAFTSHILNYNELNWNINPYFNKKNIIFIININFISLFGFFFLINLIIFI